MTKPQTIAWEKPAAITYGEALSGKQLNATLDKGKGNDALSYKPKLGTKLDAGKHTLSVTAARTKDFAATTKKVELEVKRAPQDIEWVKPTAITYDTPLDDKQLNAKLKEGDGQLEYTPKAATVLDAGEHTLTVCAKATQNYEATSATVKLLVQKAEQKIEWRDPAPMTYGEKLSKEQLNAELKIGTGQLTYNHKIGDDPPGGQYVLRVTAAETMNYKKAEAQVTLSVRPAKQSIEWPTTDALPFGQKYMVVPHLKLSEPRSCKVPEFNPKFYARDLCTLNPGKHTFTLTLPGTTDFEECKREFSFEVLPPPPRPVTEWMHDLGYVEKGHLYMKSAGKLPMKGVTGTSDIKEMHFSSFKPRDSDVPFGTADDVLDTLFPCDEMEGFHITIEWNSGERSARMKPHVYRGGKFVPGQGLNITESEKQALADQLRKHLKNEVNALKSKIAGSGKCKRT